MKCTAEEPPMQAMSQQVTRISGIHQIMGINQNICYFYQIELGLFKTRNGTEPKCNRIKQNGMERNKTKSNTLFCSPVLFNTAKVAQESKMSHKAVQSRSCSPSG